MASGPPHASKHAVRANRLASSPYALGKSLAGQALELRQAGCIPERTAAGVPPCCVSARPLRGVSFLASKFVCTRQSATAIDSDHDVHILMMISDFDIICS